MNHYNLIALSTGYVESNSLGRTIWVKPWNSLSTKREVMQDFAHQIFSLYWEDIPRRPKERKCCTTFRKMECDWTWCPECRAPLKTTMDFEDFLEFANSLHKMDADSTGGLESAGDWDPWWDWGSASKVPQDRVVEVPEWGEYAVAFSLDPVFLDQLGTQSNPPMELGKIWKKWVRNHFRVKTDEAAVKEINNMQVFKDYLK